MRPIKRLVYRIAGTQGLIEALRNVKREARIARIHRSSARHASHRLPPLPLKIQVGSGPNSKPGWLNIDLDERADLHLDLREPLTLPDGCAVIVYGEHVFEHLEHPSETTRFLAQCLRVLQPGGHLSLAVPDCEAVMRAYVEGDIEFFAYGKQHWHPATCRTWMDQVNWAFRQGNEHRYAWDEETLLLTLTDAGFIDGRRREFDPELDDESRGAYGALLVEARKPS